MSKKRNKPLVPPSREGHRGVQWRTCSGCDRSFPWITEFFHRRAKEKLDTRCKDCRNEFERVDQRREQRRDKDQRRRYHRARTRALARLSRMYPEDYQLLFKQEYTEELTQKRIKEIYEVST